jgi:uncharacterized protein
MSDRNKQIVKEVNAAFEANNPEGFLSHCADDIKWTMVGEKTTNSKAEVREWMKQMEGCEPPSFTVDTLIAEGDTAICTGDMTMKDQEGIVSQYGYCDVYRFDGDKIAELTSYVVKSKGDDERSAAA